MVEHILEYKVIARLKSNGDWIKLKSFPTTEEKTGKKIKRRFLWWTWEEDEEVIKFKKVESVDFAKSLLTNPDYQDVKVVEEVYYDTGYGSWGSGTIWVNGRWI